MAVSFALLIAGLAGLVSFLFVGLALLIWYAYPDAVQATNY